MIQGLNHLVDDEANSFPFELPPRGLLEYIEKGLLHQLKDHEDVDSGPGSPACHHLFLIIVSTGCLSALLDSC